MNDEEKGNMGFEKLSGFGLEMEFVFMCIVYV